MAERRERGALVTSGKSGPEASPIVNSYRRLIPAGARLYVNQRLPIALRYRLKKLIYAIVKTFLGAAAFGHQVATIAHPAFYRGPGKTQIEVNGKHRIALVHEHLTVLSARELNQRTVTQALDEAHIDYFAVRGVSDSHSCHRHSRNRERACPRRA